MDPSKITPPRTTTTAANAAEQKLGDRDTATTNAPASQSDREMHSLQWWGKKVCGSDLLLYHKEIMQLQRGDVLGYEWIGIVDKVGSEASNVKVGDRIVASFQIA
ncbi:hypothetical protein OIDMADRAFT_61628 [Oidiodendron maius Zn]|uniref:Alcohol dehydrogenase-like N-terminal domain-containing protein n=1 Tax=Oidiodendron maius (strain Zn) TaxID=913774 RepID=A0A0C3CUT0_OIDMZ|nr:hypothetical protein OIDMADRAFT_61628 [Oidiodendron maius Zn]